MNVLVRADAGPNIGNGHVMRCLALVQRIRELGGSAAFTLATGGPDAESVSASHLLDGDDPLEVIPNRAVRGSSEDVANTIAIARAMNADWVIADGYRFDDEYYRRIKSTGLRLLVVHDGLHEDQVPIREFGADLVLDQNIQAEPAYYEERGCTPANLLLGISFAMLRREFRSVFPQPEFPTVASQILVTFGGFATAAALLKIAHALGELEIRNTHVQIIGVAHLVGGTDGVAGVGDRQELRSVLDRLAERLRSFGGKLVVSGPVKPSAMPATMAWAHLAVSGAGSSSWEFAYLGVPSLMLALADNQKCIAEGLARRGLSENLGLLAEVATGDLSSRLAHLILSRSDRERMSRMGRSLVDGDGVNRVLARMDSVVGVEER